jgi:hypothetical protein
MNYNGFPKGMNNRQEDFALPKGTARNAVNADFDNMGRGKRRAGYTLVYSGINVRHGYESPIGSFIVEGADLKSWDGGATATTIFSGVFGEICTFDYFNGVVYFSDGIVSKKIKTGGVVADWGMSRPGDATLSSTTGLLDAGVYLGAISHINSLGEESGASTMVSIKITANRGIVFTLPSMQEAQADSYCLYLSTANGSTLYKVAETSGSSYTVSLAGYDSGKILDLEFHDAPPAGRIIRHFRGRNYIADDTGLVWYTDADDLDHVDMRNNYFQYPAPVTVMEPVDGGIFIVADRTYFRSGGDPEEASTSVLLDYGALLGTGARVLNSSNVSWMSDRGMIMGSADGQVKNMVEEQVAVESGTSGSAIVRENNGIRQFISTIKNPTVSPMAATSFINAEIIRRNE